MDPDIPKPDVASYLHGISTSKRKATTPRRIPATPSQSPTPSTPSRTRSPTTTSTTITPYTPPKSRTASSTPSRSRTTSTTPSRTPKASTPHKSPHKRPERTFVVPHHILHPPRRSPEFKRQIREMRAQEEKVNKQIGPFRAKRLFALVMKRLKTEEEWDEEHDKEGSMTPAFTLPSRRPSKAEATIPNVGLTPMDDDGDAQMGGASEQDDDSDVYVAPSQDDTDMAAGDDSAEESDPAIVVRHPARKALPSRAASAPSTPRGRKKQTGRVTKIRATPKTSPRKVGRREFNMPTLPTPPSTAATSPVRESFAAGAPAVSTTRKAKTPRKRTANTSVTPRRSTASYSRTPTRRTQNRHAMEDTERDSPPIVRRARKKRVRKNKTTYMVDLTIGSDDDDDCVVTGTVQRPLPPPMPKPVPRVLPTVMQPGVRRRHVPGLPFDSSNPLMPLVGSKGWSVPQGTAARVDTLSAAPLAGHANSMAIRSASAQPHTQLMVTNIATLPNAPSSLQAMARGERAATAPVGPNTQGQGNVGNAGAATFEDVLGSIDTLMSRLTTQKSRISRPASQRPDPLSTQPPIPSTQMVLHTSTVPASHTVNSAYNGATETMEDTEREGTETAKERFVPADNSMFDVFEETYATQIVGRLGKGGKGKRRVVETIEL